MSATDGMEAVIEAMAQAHEDVFEHDDDLTARSDDLPAFLAERMLRAALSVESNLMWGEQVVLWCDRSTYAPELDDDIATPEGQHYHEDMGYCDGELVPLYRRVEFPNTETT